MNVATIYNLIWLVDSTPLKNMKVSWDYDIPNIWGKKSYSKPPTIYNLISGFHECCHS
jgi:4-amino-4-deoxy-L-arabinose transferase-like glycosyltransferase